MRQSTGVKRLDELLKGGVPQNTYALVYGPPFLGKDVLARRFLLDGLRHGIPAIHVLTDASANDVRKALERMDPDFAKHEKAGLVRFVDTYSRSIGAADAVESVEYVDGPMDLNGVALAINNAERRVVPDHPQHRLVLDSVSTLVTYTNAATVFRFLQVLIGRTKLAGATGMILLDAGMHADSEVQTFKHIVDGVLEVRADEAKNLLQVRGLGVSDNPGWIEYRFDENDFDLTGSFAAGRIR